MDKDQKTIRWGMIGCGAVAEVKSGPAYQQTDGFELTAVMRRNELLAKDFAHRHKIEKFYTSAEQLIEDEDIDAVYIATPPDSHKTYALSVAQAGKVCCIEKPMAPSYKDCKAIVDAFEQVNLPLFVAYYRRSLPRFNKVKELLEDKAIGDVRHIQWHLSKAASDLDLSGKYNWRTDKSIAPGGYFDDLASHGLDLFAYLLGEYESAKGIAVNQQGLYTAFDAICACWLHESGVTGSGSWNFGSHSRCDTVTIYGSKGEISFSIFDEQPIWVSNPQDQYSIKIDNPKHIQQFHAENMKQFLFSGKQHPSTGQTAAHTSWVMEQILTP